MFSIYLVKMVFIFPANLILSFYEKARMILPQNILKDEISSIMEKKMIFILENIVCPLIEKLKMMGKLVQSNTSRITISIYMPFSNWQLQNKLILQLFHNWSIISLSITNQKCSTWCCVIYLRHVPKNSS